MHWTWHLLDRRHLLQAVWSATRHPRVPSGQADGGWFRPANALYAVSRRSEYDAFTATRHGLSRTALMHAWLQAQAINGVENMIAVDAAGDVIDAVTSNSWNSVHASAAIERAMRDPGQQITIGHFHPLGRSFSYVDLQMLGYAGVGRLHLLSNSADYWLALPAGRRALLLDDFARLDAAYEKAHDAVANGLALAESHGDIDADSAAIVTAHLTFLSLARAGWLNYSTSLPAISAGSFASGIVGDGATAAGGL